VSLSLQVDISQLNINEDGKFLTFIIILFLFVFSAFYSFIFFFRSLENLEAKISLVQIIVK
jgi:hypothetical protein